MYKSYLLTALLIAACNGVVAFGKTTQSETHRTPVHSPMVQAQKTTQESPVHSPMVQAPKTTQESPVHSPMVQAQKTTQESPAHSPIGEALAKELPARFAEHLLSEKVYLHTDKPAYFTGDTLWIKGYMVKASDHSPSPSSYLYVDLVDQYDTVVVAGKFKRDSTGGFKGYLILGSDLPQGNYTLRGYSMWMRNFYSQYYFYKPINISEPYSLELQLSADVKQVDSVLLLNLHLNSISGKLANLEVDCTLRNLTTGKQLKLKAERSNDQGILELPTTGVNPGDILAIEVGGKAGRHRFESSIQVEIPRGGYQVQFLPEGGDLVTGGIRRVAYKAISDHGHPMDLTGYVLCSTGDTVAYINNSHAGMGVFSFYPDAEHTYTAHTYSSDSIYKQTPLSTPRTDGVALIVHSTEDWVNYSVQKIGALAHQELYAVLHTRGLLQYVMPLSEVATNHRIPAEELSAGVSHLVVIDEYGTPLAERLFFVQPRQQDLQVSSDKQAYAMRQAVELELKLPKGVRGQFSVSVTDDQVVSTEPGADQIVSGLLLSSDLHGPLDKPATYIHSNTVDLVMLTNGWRRFKVREVLAGEKQILPYYLEAGQVITGTAYSGYKKSLKESRIFAQIYTTDSVRVAPINSDGRFEITDLDIAGIKKVSLKAVHPRNNALDARIEIDTLPPSEQTPLPYRYTSIEPIQQRATPSGAQDTLGTDDATGRFKKSWLINQVLVRARQPKPQRTYDVMDKIEPNRLSPKLAYYASPFNKYMNYINPNHTLCQLLRFSGKIQIAEYLYTYIIDGVEFKLDKYESIEGRLPHYMGHEITAIEYIDPPKSICTIFVIETRFSNPYAYQKSIAKDMAVFDFVGYDRCEKECYAPTYTTPNTTGYASDFRSTLYWNPSVTLSEKPTKLRFYTSDQNAGTYTVTIEGITDNNEPMYQTHTITRIPEG